jgi:ribonucleoside-diphosphate reductase alpha chain
MAKPTASLEEVARLQLEISELKAKVAMPQRRKLPVDRVSRTVHFVIKSGDGDEDGYLIVGFYEDGTVGEFFIKMAKQGSLASGFADQWAIACSLLLQTGTPLEDLCKRFIGTRFEPSGRSNLPECRMALSVVDLVAKFLHWRFVRKCAPDDQTER